MRRWLVFALLAANAGVLLWLLAGQGGALSPTDEPGGEPTLKLYREASPQEIQQAVAAKQTGGEDLPAAESAPEVRAMTDQPASAPVAPCMRVGPFSSEAAADTVASRLRNLGYSPVKQSGTGRITAGFWVYLPPYDTHADAVAAAERLKAKGVEDLFIVGGDENANAISLGLFSTAERARNRAAAIRKIGFDPDMVERHRQGTVYWLAYREPSDQTLDLDSLGVLPGVDEPLRREPAEQCSQ